MPLTPAAPQTESIPTPQDVTLDRIKILHIAIDLDPNDPTKHMLTVSWAVGYDDGGTFVGVKSGGAVVSGAALGTALAGAPSGSSVYDAVKTALYGLLQSEGHLPAGAIS